jgi:hypothetical protein
LATARLKSAYGSPSAEATPPAAVEPNSVLISPGSMQMTSMPKWRTSIRSASLIASTAYLVA